MGILFRFWQDLCPGKRYARAMVYAMFLSMFVSTALARRYPSGIQGAQVVHGSVSFGHSGNTTTINASDRSVIDYRSFDIARSDIVRFIQPGAQASVLNRITSAKPTNIEGTLQANGRVFFVNPAGVYIGENAQINVNQLVASGLNISNADFLNDQMNFTDGDGTVTNQGDIIAEEVYFLGRHVINAGDISCLEGHVILAAGERVFVRELNGEVRVEISPSTGSEPQDSPPAMESEPGVLNQGTIEVGGGRITLGAGDIYAQAVSNIGSMSASVTTDQGGQIELNANAGQISNAGSIEARSDSAKGGSIAAKADEVINFGTIDVTGSEGGSVVLDAIRRLGQFGTIHADGTDTHGGDVSLHAGETAALSSESLTTANAGPNGDGGNVTVFSPNTALVWSDARIEAQGGTESGDGGFVEVSGLRHVEISGSVDASANRGAAGTFRIDTTGITVVDDIDYPGEPELVDPDTGEPWIFRPTGDENEITDDVIEGLLGGGTTVTLETANTDDAPGGGDIVVTAPIDPSQELPPKSKVTLTLNAVDGIEIRPNTGIDASELGNRLDVVLQANHGSGSDNAPEPTYGNVEIHAPVKTNGGDFTSSGARFDNSNGPIHAEGGNVVVNQTGDVRASSMSGRDIEITSDNALTVAEGQITATESIHLHAGADGTGDLSFEPGTSLSSEEIALRAGDGLDCGPLGLTGISLLVCQNNESVGGDGTDAKVVLDNLEVAGGTTSLTIWQDASIVDTPKHTQFETEDTFGMELILQSDDGSVSSSTADIWKSITANALAGITLDGSGSVTTKALKTRTDNISVHSTTGSLVVTGKIDANWREDPEYLGHDPTGYDDIGTLLGGNGVPGGGVELLADDGSIQFTPESDRSILVQGYSDDLDADIGVELPDGSGRAGIVFSSQEDLSLGSTLELSVYGEYEAQAGNGKGKDDRQSVGFLSGPAEYDGSGDPIDASVYLRSTGGDVTVNSSARLYRNGTMVVDAKNSIRIGPKFVESWKTGVIAGLEVVSRITNSLSEAARYNRLPGAAELSEGHTPTWMVDAADAGVLEGAHGSIAVPGGENGYQSPSPFVLRGGEPGIVLASSDVHFPPAADLRDGSVWISPWIVFLKPILGVALPEMAVEEREAQAKLATSATEKEEDQEKTTPVLVVREGQVLGLKEGLALREGDIVTTGPNIAGFIRFGESSHIIMEPNTCVVISKSDANSPSQECPGVFVESGKVWYWAVWEDAERLFVIRTANAEVFMPGTVGPVSYSADGDVTGIGPWIAGPAHLSLDGSAKYDIPKQHEIRVVQGTAPPSTPATDQEFQLTLKAVLALLMDWVVPLAHASEHRPMIELNWRHLEHGPRVEKPEDPLLALTAFPD